MPKKKIDLQVQKSLFDHDYRLTWPPHSEFPITEPSQEFQFGIQLKKDLEKSDEYIIITGFTSISFLIKILGSDDYPNLKKVSIVIGNEPDNRIAKKLFPTTLSKEVKNFWVKKGVSIFLSGPLVQLIERIDNGRLSFKIIDKLHAKIYVNEFSAVLGSSNFSFSGTEKQREANIRVQQDKGDKREEIQYRSIRKIAENYFELGTEYNEGIKELIGQLLKDSTWQEAIVRAVVEISENTWLLEIPHLAKAIHSKKLWPCQKIAISRSMKIIQDQGTLLLADPTGSGKTAVATTLAYAIFHWLYENGNLDHSQAVVICPKQITSQWTTENESFSIECRVESMGMLSSSASASAKENERIRKAIEGTDILIVDEVHNYLNHKSKRSQSIQPKKSSIIILATATPINKRAKDLLRLIELLNIDNLTDLQIEDCQKLRNSKEGSKGPKYIQYLNNVRSYINQFIVRRTKKEINQLIDLDPNAYINKRGIKCRYPRTLTKTYPTGETEQDKKICQTIINSLEKLKGVNYLIKWKLPPYLVTPDEKIGYINGRFKGSSALAAFQVKAAFRSSHCALFELLFGTIAAEEKFEIKSAKAASGKIIETLEKVYDGSNPKIDFPIEWLEDKNKWIGDEVAFKAEVAEEISIYKKVAELLEGYSGSREKVKTDFLVSQVNRHSKVLAFDSKPITLAYLSKLLNINGNSGFTTIVATGSQENNKKKVFEKFALDSMSSTEKVIGLCSDAMSESINLQAAQVLVLLDVPSVLRIIEQRIGRLERLDSEHENIFVYWPDDSAPFSLNGDKKIIQIMLATQHTIGGNVDIPNEGKYKEYWEQLANGDTPWEAYQKIAENEEEWKGVQDVTQIINELIEGSKTLVPKHLVEQYKDVYATVKSAVSVVEGSSEWSFFAFRGDSRRSSKWLFLDGINSWTQFAEVCQKLREKLSDKDLIQKSWNDVEIENVLRNRFEGVRRWEISLLPNKKNRALRKAKEFLEEKIKSKSEKVSIHEICMKLLKLFPKEFDAKKITPSILQYSKNQSSVDLYHFADLWLTHVLLPELDKLRKVWTKKRKILSLLDIDVKKLTVDQETLFFILDSCEQGQTLDEMVASCIIGVKQK